MASQLYNVNHVFHFVPGIIVVVVAHVFLLGHRSLISPVHYSRSVFGSDILLASPLASPNWIGLPFKYLLLDAVCYSACGTAYLVPLSFAHVLVVFYCTS